jgi:hypothetical protein
MQLSFPSGDHVAAHRDQGGSPFGAALLMLIQAENRTRDRNIIISGFFYPKRNISKGLRPAWCRSIGTTFRSPLSKYCLRPHLRIARGERQVRQEDSG